MLVKIVRKLYKVLCSVCNEKKNNKINIKYKIGIKTLKYKKFKHIGKKNPKTSSLSKLNQVNFPTLVRRASFGMALKINELNYTKARANNLIFLHLNNFESK